jgi:hypothetical protein
VGTSILEDLFYQSEHTGVTNRVFEYVRNAKITGTETVAVLRGVYPDVLEHLGLEHQMSSVLTAEQIAWLVDSNASGRHDYL